MNTTDINDLYLIKKYLIKSNSINNYINLISILQNKLLIVSKQTIFTITLLNSKNLYIKIQFINNENKQIKTKTYNNLQDLYNQIEKLIKIYESNFIL